MGKIKEPQLLTQAGYAKHRGITRQAVFIAVTDGRISTIKNGKKRSIDPVIADKEWARNTSKENYVLEEPVDTSEPVAYALSRAKKEKYNAKIAKLEFEERSGRLVCAEKIKKDAFKLGRNIRDSILNIPDRVAAQLASETEAFEVHKILKDELTKALSELCEGNE